MGTKVNVRAALAADVAVNGTFTVPYPSGYTQATLTGSIGGQVRVNDNDVFKQGIGAQFAFGASSITITNTSPIIWPLGAYLRIGFDTTSRNGSYSLTLGTERNQAASATSLSSEPLAAHLFGMRVSDTDPATEIASDETWLGAPLDMVHLFLETANGNTTWAQNLTITQNLMSVYANVNKMRDYALPLASFSGGQTLANTAAGLYDSTILQILQTIAAADNQPYMRLRIGWEFPYASAYPHSSQGKEADYIAAFRRVALMAKSVSPRFKTQWIGVPVQYVNSVAYDPSLAYPGDDVVDIIGMDCYWTTADFQQGFTETQIWNFRLNNPFSLQWYADFAVAHGKAFSIPEWGIASNASTLLSLFIAFLRQQNLSHALYWNRGIVGQSNNGFDCAVTNDQYPALSTGIKARFGPIAITTGASVSGTTKGAVNTQIISNRPTAKWSIVGGVDASKFSIGPTGFLTNNLVLANSSTFAVTVRATDRYGVFVDKALTVTTPPAQVGNSSAYVVALAL